MSKLILPIILLLLATSCKQDQSHGLKDDTAIPKTSDITPSALGNNETPNGALNKNNELNERKIIRTGNLEFETTDLKGTRVKLDSLTKMCNGYIANESVNNDTYKQVNTIHIKVPAQNFSLLVETISTIVGKFEVKNIQSNDFTNEYVDVLARVNAKKGLENRYLQLLTKATKVSEMLEIERQLGEVRTEIESMEGRTKWMKHQAQMSSITVVYYQIHSSVSNAKKSSEIVEAIVGGWKLLISIIVKVLYLWPLILIGMLGYFVRKFYRRT
jgi:hypothetical protein